MLGGLLLSLNALCCHQCGDGTMGEDGYVGFLCVRSLPLASHISVHKKVRGFVIA